MQSPRQDLNRSAPSPSRPELEDDELDVEGTPLPDSEEAVAIRPSAHDEDRPPPAAVALALATPLPVATRLDAAKPLLASDALIEDIAPLEPARRAARTWSAVVAGVLLLLGALPLLGFRPGGTVAGLPAFALAGVALVAAVARVTYRQRAVAMVAVGVLAAILGARGLGPADGLDTASSWWAAARHLAAVAVAAALLFRGHYRAYAPARWLLAVALVTSAPFLVHAGLRLAPLELSVSSAGAGLAALALLASLTGFMGSQTTGAGSYLAALVIVALAADLVLVHPALASAGPDLYPQLRAAADATLAGVAAAGTATLTALGLFQIAAWRLAPDARRIDLHRPPSEYPKRPPEPGADWSTRS